MNYSELLQLAKSWGNFISDRIIIWRLLFIKEYPHHLLFEGTFEEGKAVYGVRTRRFSISKPSLWCGDVKIQKVSDGSLVGAKEVEDDE